MSRIPEIPREQLPDFEPMFQQLEQGFGFVPNDYLAMAHAPAVMQIVVEWTSKLMFSEGEIEMPLRILVAYVASKNYGCMYCTSHCISLGSNAGISLEKMEHIDDFETHAHFTDRERAALLVVKNAYQQPNAVRTSDFNALREHFNNAAIVEIMGIACMMAFYTKWNDTMNTVVEELGYEKSKKISRYNAGKHTPANI